MYMYVYVTSNNPSQSGLNRHRAFVFIARFPAQPLYSLLKRLSDLGHTALNINEDVQPADRKPSNHKQESGTKTNRQPRHLSAPTYMANIISI